MKVFFSPYTLTPKKQLNRLSSLEKKTGVFIKAILGHKVLFADYFPHLPLGDRSVDQFLAEFKFQENDYDRKVFALLLKDNEFQKLVPKNFFNHQLWSGGEEIVAPTVKYKLLSPDDRNFFKALERNVRVRPDLNGLFTRENFLRFVNDIPLKMRELIDYAEDPLAEKDWKDLPLPVARDFIEGTPYEYYIYKPNCEVRPKSDAKIIYSSYLGEDLGRYHAYCELILEADLTLTHGIATFGFFQEEKIFFNGNYQDGFIADAAKVRRLYKWMDAREWKTLCSM
jgi:hypothetical protein